jgi:hypothetical protein
VRCRGCSGRYFRYRAVIQNYQAPADASSGALIFLRYLPKLSVKEHQGRRVKNVEEEKESGKRAMEAD